MSNINFEQVLNFNFSTKMLFRCTKREFAEDIKRGKFYFNIPQKWIEEEEKGNKGQGDSLEGTFLSALRDDDSEFIRKMKLNSQIEHFEYGDFIYFRKIDIKKLYCLCFYGLNDNNFNKEIDKFGKAKYTTKVTKEYFGDFANGICKEKYSDMKIKDQPVVVFISKPHVIFQKIREFFMSKGIKKEEIIISPVEYLDKKKIAISCVEYPKELLLKDIDFVNQSEIRVIINSKSEELQRYMEQNGNVIDIGDISEMVEIYDYYFEDLYFEINDNKMIFNLSKPIFEPLEEKSLRSLIELYAQMFWISDTHLEKVDREDVKREIERIVKEKYNVYLANDNGVVKLLGVNQEIHNEIDSWQEPKRTIDNFVRRVEELIEKNANNQIYEILKKVDKEDVCYPYTFYLKGIMLKKDNCFQEALDKFSYCIDNNVNKEKSLEFRSYCYSMLGMYELAINDINSLQDFIGYRKEIYVKRGVDLLHLNRNLDALQEFNKALEISSSYGYALYNRGVAYYRLGDKILAENDMRRAIECEPEKSRWSSEYEKFFGKIND